MQVIEEPGQKVFSGFLFLQLAVVSEWRLEQNACVANPNCSPVPGRRTHLTSGSFPFSPVQC